MKSDTNLLCVLMDIGFYDSANKFDEIYGEGVSYRQLEQDTYVELKSMVISLLNRKIKFKKCRDIDKNADPMNLTVQAEMFEKEYDIFRNAYEKGHFTFLYNFIVSNIQKVDDNK